MELIVGIIIGTVAYHVLSCPERREHLLNAFKPKPKANGNNSNPS